MGTDRILVTADPLNGRVPLLEARYGRPRVCSTLWGTEPFEYRLLERAVRAGRAHDVTLFIRRKDRLAVIRKPSYPPGVYRPPSGGVEPGESFEEGACREAFEETGLEVALVRYLLRAEVVFLPPGPSGETIGWCSHVFLAEWRGGEPCPVDTREIQAARWASIQEVQGPLQRKLDTAPTAGLRYRGWLQRSVFSLWKPD